MSGLPFAPKLGVLSDLVPLCAAAALPSLYGTLLHVSRTFKCFSVRSEAGSFAHCLCTLPGGGRTVSTPPGYNVVLQNIFVPLVWRVAHKKLKGRTLTDGLEGTRMAGNGSATPFSLSRMGMCSYPTCL